MAVTTTLANNPPWRLIAVSFFVVATDVAVEVLRDLVFLYTEPGESTVATVLAGLLLIVMPALALAKRRTTTRLGSPTPRADPAETILCAWCQPCCSGLAPNTTIRWWWADLLAALGIAALAANEAWEAWRGESCDDDRDGSG